MADIGKMAEWLRGYHGVISIEIEGECPARLCVEFATEEAAAQFISMAPLIEGIKVSLLRECIVAIEDD